MARDDGALSRAFLLSCYCTRQTAALFALIDHFVLNRFWAISLNLVESNISDKARLTRSLDFILGIILGKTYSRWLTKRQK